jgi:PadR family transcriptional regulator
MSGRFLAEFELYVMLAIARLDDGAYGAAVRKAIEERTGRPISIGALYATLGRLSDKGLLRHHVSDPEPVRGGRSRKYYRLTAKGKSALSHSAEMMRKMMEGVHFTPKETER